MFSGLTHHKIIPLLKEMKSTRHLYTQTDCKDFVFYYDQRQYLVPLSYDD